MNKRTAVAIAGRGIPAGDLRKVLNNATFDGDEPSSVSGNYTKRRSHDEMRTGIASLADGVIVGYFSALNILREFGEDEPVW